MKKYYQIFRLDRCILDIEKGPFCTNTRFGKSLCLFSDSEYSTEEEALIELEKFLEKDKTLNLSILKMYRIDDNNQ